MNFKVAFGRQMALFRVFSFGIGKSYLLLPVTFLVAVGIGTVILGLIYYVHELYHASPGTIGLFTSTYFLSYFMGCFFTRPLGRKILPRYSMILATGSMTVLITLILILPGLTLSFILISLYGFSVSLFFPPIAGWMSSGIEGASLSKAISRWNISWSTGTILSPYIAGFLSEKDIRYPVILSIGLFLFCTLLILSASLFLPQIKNDKYQDTRSNIEEGRKDYSTFFRFPSWLLVFTVYVLAGVIFNIFPIYAKEELGISESNVGIILLIRAFFSTICFIILGKTASWHFKPKLILLFQILLVGLIAVMLSAGTFISYALLMPFFGIIVAVAYSFSLFHGTSGSLERAKRTAINELVISSGVMVGATAGGQIFQNYSMLAVYLFCMSVAAAGVILQLFLLRKSTVRSTE